MSAKCDPHEICEECPEWIFTLADLLMCMMGLFVILWVLKPDPAADEEQATREQIRQQETIRDIQIAFGARIDENSEVEMRLEELMRKLEQIRRLGPGERGNSLREQKGADGTDPEVQSIRDGERAAIGGRVNFDAGVAHLSDDQRYALEQVASKIRGHRNVVLVKGHSGPDDLPEGANLDDHMELSLLRARVVASYLIESGVSPDILRLQGCGTFEPIRLRAYTEADRLVNRRVEVEATDQLVQARSDAPAVMPLAP